MFVMFQRIACPMKSPAITAHEMVKLGNEGLPSSWLNEEPAGLTRIRVQAVEPLNPKAGGPTPGSRSRGTKREGKRVCVRERERAREREYERKRERERERERARERARWRKSVPSFSLSQPAHPRMNVPRRTRYGPCR